MNTRIEQLTRTYLDGLPYLWRLDNEKKRRIIEINGNSEWIIFNAGSLRAKRKEYTDYDSAELIWVNERNRIWDSDSHRFLDIGDFLRRRVNLVGEYRLGEWEERDVLDRNQYLNNGERNPTYGHPTGTERVRPVWGRIREESGQVSSEHKIFLPGRNTGGGLHPEQYDLDSPHLKDICREVVKIYEGEDEEIGVIIFQNGFQSPPVGDKNPALPTSYDHRGDDNYWVAINKKEASEQYGLIDVFCVNDDRRHWKRERNLQSLLDSNDIINSRERVADTSSAGGNSHSTPNTPPPNNFFTGTQPNIPTSNPTSQFVNVSFTIDKVSRIFGDIGYFILEPTNSFSLLGNQIIRVYIEGNSNDLQAGNTTTINNVQLQRGRASIDNNGTELFIASYYDSVQVDSRNNNSSSPQSNTSQTPSNSPPLPTYQDVKQKNHDLILQEDEMVLLAEELVKVIDKNQQVFQEGQSLGLSLPHFSTDVLNYFQEEFFVQLDENQPLNSSHNSQINAINDRVKTKKLNIKNNIYRIYKSNVKKLTDKKQKNQNGPSSPPPENELTKTKKQVIEKINEVLTNLDNLRNIDLNILANGKYQNWENDIEKLTNKDEVIAYGNAFFAALKETGDKEKEQEEKDNKISSSTGSQNSPENNPISVNTKKTISSLPLPAAKNIAKNQIRELFNKYKPDLEKLKEIWKGEKIECPT